MWGIIPAAGVGSRIQPLAFSKELLPVGSAREGGVDRPRAVSEYLVERMLLGGATKICFVISPGKSDIVEYYAAGDRGAPVDLARPHVGAQAICYVVQPEATGLCDAIFRALPLVRDDAHVLVGLPDTVWFPADGLAQLGDDALSFLCFPVERPDLFDAVTIRPDGSVAAIQVKQTNAASEWVWGAFKVSGKTLRELHELWLAREPRDVYVGTLVTEWLARGGKATAVPYGRAYVDTGTVGGYREAIQLLEAVEKLDGPRGSRPRARNPRVETDEGPAPR